MTGKPLEPIPKFKSYQEELAFWRSHRLTDYVSSKRNAKRMYSKNLVCKITTRFSPEDLTKLRNLAAQQKLNVTSLIRLEMLKVLSKD